MAARKKSAKKKASRPRRTAKGRNLDTKLSLGGSRTSSAREALRGDMRRDTWHSVAEKKRDTAQAAKSRVSPSQKTRDEAELRRLRAKQKAGYAKENRAEYADVFSKERRATRERRAKEVANAPGNAMGPAKYLKPKKGRISKKGVLSRSRGKGKR